MRNERGNALVVLLAVLALAAGVETVLLVRLSGRVRALESRLDRSAAAPGSTTPLALGGEIREIREEVDALARGQKSLREHVAKEVRRLEKEQQAVAEAAVRTGPAGSPEEVEKMKEALLAQVQQTVEARLKDLPKRGGGEWKPTIEEFRKELGLTEEQTRRAERVFDDAKHEVYELASLRRPDGTCKLDDMVEALKDPVDPEAAMKKVFASLFTEKIPGRDEPYISEVIRIQGGTREALGAILSEEQRSKLLRLNLDYLGVKTAYDPFAEYIQEALR